MRSEKEIREFLKKCSEVASFGVSDGPCPLNDDPDYLDGKGCCAECSFPSTIRWVLGDDEEGNKNGQQRLIDSL